MAASSKREQAEERSEARDETLLSELVVDLLLEGLELHDGEIGVDAGQGVADDLFKAGDGMGGLDHDGAGVHGLVFVEGVVGVVGAAGGLRERQKVHGVVLPVDAGVGGVFHHADNFMRSIHASLARAGKTKAMADGVAVAEELLDEFLVDDGDGRRIERVLRL